MNKIVAFIIILLNSISGYCQVPELKKDNDLFERAIKLYSDSVKVNPMKGVFILELICANTFPEDFTQNRVEGTFNLRFTEASSGFLLLPLFIYESDNKSFVFVFTGVDPFSKYYQNEIDKFKVKFKDRLSTNPSHHFPELRISFTRDLQRNIKVLVIN